MKPLNLILLSVTLSTTLAAGVVSLLNPAPVEGQVSEDNSREVSAEQIDRLEQRLAAQEEFLRDLSAKLELRAPRNESVSRREDLEFAVRKAIRLEREKEIESALAVDAELELFDAERERDKLIELGRSGAGENSIQEFWNEVRSRGHMDAVIASFEEYAQLHSTDPQVQIELGNVYLVRLQDAQTGPDMGIWATKADGAFDSALALDGENWEARFSKAVALSFWPPLFGKQGEAINQFEVLLDQQALGAPSGHHAQTYLYLGNLYQQQGDAEKAMQIWQNGNAAFPESAALASKLIPQGQN